MSVPNEKPEVISSEARLTQWGAAERSAPPMRPGRFAALSGRLISGTGAAQKPRGGFLPRLAWGGAVVVAATVGLGSLLNSQTQREKAQLEETARNMPPAAVAAALADTTTTVPKNESHVITLERNKLSASVNPVFRSSGNYLLSTRDYSTVPFAVTIQNKGDVFSANIVVTSESRYMGGVERRDVYPVVIAGGGAITHKTVYAALTRDASRGACTISLERENKRRELYSLGMPYGRVSQQRTIALLDKRFGVLSVRRNVADRSGEYISAERLYANPVDAPDRASGYDSVDALVLGEGTDKLTAPQWNAIQEWVKRGGSLVLLGKTIKSGPLSTASAQELSPYLPSGRLKRGATPIEMFRSVTDYVSVSALASPSQPLVASRNVGIGTVTQLQFDPTTADFRSHYAGMASVWNGVANRSGGSLSAAQIRSMGTQTPWDIENMYSGPRPMQRARYQTDTNNPFVLRLPDLRTVTYVFLGYFVLVVPAAFVVLKQTRRLQYAWATGPALAVLFAGGVGVMSLGLYRNPVARRTAGLVVMNAGEGQARFAGFSELYVPRGGSYRIDLPGTDQTLDDLYYQPGYGAPRSDGGLGSITTQEMGTQGSNVEIDMPNLSFRRIYHQQTMSLGQGITADLRIDKNETLSGTVTNTTGRVLRNAFIMTRSANIDSDKSRFPVYLYRLGDVQTGQQLIKIDRMPQRDIYSQVSLHDVFPLGLSWFYNGVPSESIWNLSPSAPLLLAHTDGKEFGPQGFGKSVGGDSSVGVMVRLPLLNNVNTTKGGDAR